MRRERKRTRRKLDTRGRQALLQRPERGLVDEREDENIGIWEADHRTERRGDRWRDCGDPVKGRKDGVRVLARGDHPETTRAGHGDLCWQRGPERIAMGAPDAQDLVGHGR